MSNERDLITPERDRLESLADRVSAKYLAGAAGADIDDVEDEDAIVDRANGEGPVDPDADLKVALLAASGCSLEAVRGVAETARSLKRTETDYRTAQQRYAEAVKRLSDEACK